MISRASPEPAMVCAAKLAREHTARDFAALMEADEYAIEVIIHTFCENIHPQSGPEEVHAYFDKLPALAKMAMVHSFAVTGAEYRLGMMTRDYDKELNDDG